MLSTADGVFCGGRAEFVDQLQEASEQTAKIYVRFSVDANGTQLLLTGQLDTGAAWSILEPEVAREIGAFALSGPSIPMRHGDRVLAGKLVRLPLTLVADDGDSLEVEATVFVCEDWTRETFLGYNGLLERVRFAVDPGSRHFFFGRIGD